jgi:hypothetical protein
VPSISESLVTEVIDGVERTFFVDPETGGRKEVKLARTDLIPVFPFMQLAEHYGRGALKYADRNWELGYPFSVSYAALIRHVMQWWGGEEFDEETGSHHLTAVAWHAFALRQLVVTHPERDDRPAGAPGVNGVVPEDPFVTDLMSYLAQPVDLSKPPLEDDGYVVAEPLRDPDAEPEVRCAAGLLDEIAEASWDSPTGGVWLKDEDGRMLHVTLPAVS